MPPVQGVGMEGPLILCRGGRPIFEVSSKRAGFCRLGNSSFPSEMAEGKLFPVGELPVNLTS